MTELFIMEPSLGASGGQDELSLWEGGVGHDTVWASWVP